jgi:hypothetical protein
MTDRPNPESTRRDGVPALPVRLADGQEWGFALPTVRLSPRVVVLPDALGRPVERISVAVGFGYPAEVQELIDGVGAACEGGTASEQYASFFSLAAVLIRRAHDVSMATACELLAVPGNELSRLVGAVMQVVSAGPEAPAGESQGGSI